MKLFKRLLLMMLLILDQTDLSIIDKTFDEIAHFYQDYFDHVTDSSYYSNYSIHAHSTLNIAKNPLSSFNIIMNFNFDGTTGLLLMDSNREVTFHDTGHCPHGYMYDPILNVCRQIFCLDGFELNDNDEKCLPNENATIAAKDKDIRIKLDLNILNDYLVCKKEHDGTMCCGLEFLEALVNTFAELFEVKPERFQDVKVLGQNFDKFNQNDFDWQFVNNETTGWLNDTLILGTQRLKIEFTILDATESQKKDTKEPLQIYFHLKALGQIKKILEKYDRLFYLSSIEEAPQEGKKSWCCAVGDDKKLLYDNYRILIDNKSNKAQNSTSAKYYIIDDRTGIIYETGEFFLQILYVMKAEIPKSYDAKKHSLLVNYKGQSLLDVTDRFPSLSDHLLQVCNRAPRITYCPTAVTYTVGICEYTYNNLSREYCPRTAGIARSLKCLTIDEYELDPNGVHLRICQRKEEDREDFENTAEFVSTVIAGYMSSVCLAMSMMFMLATLVTYGLFKELRNIPGWNIINVTLALLLAQFFFFVGSFIDQYAQVCFVVAICTHYGLLVSFCWMNVIAFDLYRNFRRRSSHVILKTIRVQDRLVKYALFGWLFPLIIIIPSVCFDFFTTNDCILRPCYALFLNGCEEARINNRMYKPNDLLGSSFSDDCVANMNTSSTILNPRASLHMRNCWMYNGFASLVFFGIPMAVIIGLNAVFFLLTIHNIRKIKRRQRDIRMRRFSKTNIPGNDDVKFFFQIAVIMGFTFFVGFFQTIFDNVVFYQILSHIFNLCNALLGVFIFFVFIFRPNVRRLYINLLHNSDVYRQFAGRKTSVKPISRPRNTSSTNSQLSSSTLASSCSVESREIFETNVFTISPEFQQSFKNESSAIKEEDDKKSIFPSLERIVRI